MSQKANPSSADQSRTIQVAQWIKKEHKGVFGEMAAHICSQVGTRLHFTSDEVWYSHLTGEDLKFVQTLTFKNDGYHRGRGMHIVSQYVLPETGSQLLPSLPQLKLPGELRSIVLKREIGDPPSQHANEIIGNEESFDGCLLRTILLHRLVDEMDEKAAQYDGEKSVYLDGGIRSITLSYHTSCVLWGDWSWEQVFRWKKVFDDVMDEWKIGKRMHKGICL